MTRTAQIAMLKRQIARGGCRRGGTPDARREQELRRWLDALEAERDDAALEAELADIDTAWDALVTDAAFALYGRPGDYRHATAHRNRQARKLARRGLRPMETVSAEMRRRAEQYLLDLIDARHGDARADQARQRILRGEQIRAELTARADHRSGIFAVTA